jgi:putative ABC transport system permease protein
MRSPVKKKAFRDLKQHPLRSTLTIITIAAAVAAVWTLAVPRTLDAAVRYRQDLDLTHHIRLSPQNLWYSGEDAEPPLAEAQITATETKGLAGLPNVAAVDSRPTWQTRARVGGEEHQIWLVGIDDFSKQRVNVVDVETGRLPTDEGLQVIVDSASILSDRLPIDAGDEIEIRAGDGEFYPFTVSGVGGTFGLNPSPDDESPVFYVRSETVHLFLAHDGFNSIEVRLADPSLLDATLADITNYLDRVAPEADYWRLSEMSRPGAWAGRDRLDRLLPLLYVLAAVATGSALILIGTTMNNIIRGQTREIGVMKAIGASSRVIRGSCLRSALLLGGMGAALGTIVGLAVSRALGTYAQEQLLGIEPVERFDVPIALAATGVGLIAPTIAALPAVRRAMRISVREALGDYGTGNSFGRNAIDRAFAKASLIGPMAQIGVRNVARRKARSMAAIAQVALGIGAAVAFGAFAVTGVSISSDTLAREGSDITVYGDMRLLDPDDAVAMSDLADVAAVQPTIDATAQYQEGELSIRGLPVDPIYDPILSSGRWFTALELDRSALVGIIGAPIADITGTGIGDTLEISTRAGIHAVEVIGVDDGMVQDGQFMWMPLTTVLDIEGFPSPPVYWVEATSAEPEVVDRATAEIEKILEQPGNPVTVHARHRDLEAARQEDKVVGGVIQIFALPILAIAMIGLVSAMTTNVLERTREIGVLRSLGARSRNLRRIFRVEGVTLSVVGWLAGLPIGYALAELTVWLFGRALHTNLNLLFPAWLPFIALLGVILVAMLALRPPLRRAVCMQAGMAIRYE